ncbi:MAG: ABC transporter permease [Paludisphaera borealis]|uniref:ABC transporter permease n=1 Tax=Paludisphaera borealis TaxID=1387353 RepID=UPI002850C1AB|nr:ABC transporter permease [Paludisphaera borealis]MDR3623240.1 ABC transporter permease [Paludisphaera borealis]
MDVCNETSVAATDSFPAPPSVRQTPSWSRRIQTDYAELTRFWPVVQNMVMQELHVRYQRSFMGFLWTLINPLLMMMILSIVFSNLFPSRENYSVFLLAGIVPWTFMAGSISEATACILVNEGLIRKIYVPKLVFPLVRVLINLVTMVLSLAALFVLLLPLGARPSLPMLLLPVAMGLFVAFTLGLSLLVATTNTFFRDCAHLVSVFLQAWYFATPIIYHLEDFPEPVRWRFWLNPAFYFIEIFHDILCEGRWPQISLMIIATVLATVSLGVGYATFKSNEDKMVFRL